MPLKQTTGSRAQVMHGTAKKTTGGLTKSQLKYNKQGKIVSKKASALAKKNNRLVKAGYVTKKGKFGVSMRGGIPKNVMMPQNFVEKADRGFMSELEKEQCSFWSDIYGPIQLTATMKIGATSGLHPAGNTALMMSICETAR